MQNHSRLLHCSTGQEIKPQHGTFSCLNSGTVAYSLFMIIDLYTLTTHVLAHYVAFSDEMCCINTCIAMILFSLISFLADVTSMLV